MDKKNWELIYKEKCNDFKQYPSILPPVKRIIVIGDLHGDWDMTIKSLVIAKVIKVIKLKGEEDSYKWIGGETIVVQVGDQIDRCRFSGISCALPQATANDEAKDLDILNLFTNLHSQAQLVGGAVYSIIGNHELMNVKSDMRYVSYENIKSFEKYKKPDGSIIQDGMEARKWAFSPGNPIANFLGCTRQLSLIIGSNLFVHAGVVPKIAKKYGVEDMNQIMSLFLWDKLNANIDHQELLDSSDYSPLWNRVYGSKLKSNDSCDHLMGELKKYYKIDRMFIGHTPQTNSGITNACNGRIWLTDYGSSKAFDQFDTFYLQNNERSQERKAQVLEILDDGKQINILKDKKIDFLK
jgi:hypothetical protein